MAVAFGGLDHGQGGTILDTSTWIEELELGQKMTGQISAHPVEPDQRCVTDKVEEGVGHLHRRARVRHRKQPHTRRYHSTGVVGIEGHRETGRMKPHSGGQRRRRSIAADDTDVSRNASAHLRHGGGAEYVLRDADDMTSPLDELVRHIIGSHHDQDVHAWSLNHPIRDLGHRCASRPSICGVLRPFGTFGFTHHGTRPDSPNTTIGVIIVGSRSAGWRGNSRQGGT